VEPRDAATVLLCRDAPRLEVFLLQRNLGSVFAAGAHVFPGGAVDDEDELLAPRGGTEAAGPAVVPDRFRVAAIREAFEEAGVLLARDTRTGAPVDSARLSAARAALRRGDRTFGGLVDELGVRLDIDALTPIARFVTPPGAPRRYDTWFFVTAAPRGHAYRHDEDETVASVWMRPPEALTADRRGDVWLVEPTRWTLEAVADFARSDDLLHAARAAWTAYPSPVTAHDARRGWQLPLAALGPAPAAEAGPSRRRKTPA
jgi:8-oxo-dGTP pyrophosphatase MutT (NUDIX family)